MPHDRYYHPDLTHKTLNLTGDEHTHLYKVMRKNPGDQIEIIDGHGKLAQGVIEKLDKKIALISIQTSSKSDPAPEKILALGLTKQPKLELAIEKGTELGITKFILFPAEKSEREVLSENHLKRLHSLILSATKQCGRLYFPALEIYSSLPKLEDAAYATLSPDTKPLHLSDVKAVYIGPEKGWSKSEETTLSAFAKKASLHQNTLRAETAAIAAASLIGLHII